MRTIEFRCIEHFFRRLIFLVGLLMACLSITTRSGAAALMAPLGGAPVALPSGYVACASAEPGGWTVKRGDRQIIPPTMSATDEIGRPLTISTARSLAECPTRSEPLQLVALRAIPKIEPKSVIIFLDEGRLEFSGRNLEGLLVQWSVGGHHGEGTCLVNIDASSQRETCAIALKKGLPAQLADTRLHLIPAGSSEERSAVVFDAAGRVLPNQAFELAPYRLVVSRLMDTQQVVDLSHGSAVITTSHPEAIGAIDCSPAQCDLTEQGFVVKMASGISEDLLVRPRLIPRVSYSTFGDTTPNPSLHLKVAFCPMSVISGPAFRDVDDGRVILRLDADCGKQASNMSFTVNDARVEIDKVDTPLDATYVVLRTGRLSGTRARIQARRASTDSALVAVAEAPLLDAPLVLTTLTLPGHGPIDFIPTNRDAILTFQGNGGNQRLVPIAVRGVYDVHAKSGELRVRGLSSSGGYVSIRFAVRGDNLPDAYSNLNLATVTDPVQRPLREANVPTPLAGGLGERKPVIELLCVGAADRIVALPVGEEVRLPFRHRDSCRMVIHRSRIPKEDGEQKLDLSVKVTSVSGASRSGGEISQQLLLRHSEDDLSFYLHGIEDHYDRFVIRVSHVVDESTLSTKAGRALQASVAQWTVVVESARARFYATAAIPTSLFRFSNDPEDLGTGPLNLNFGLLSRLTWLTGEGKEGLLGLEAGVMAMGLSTANDRQLNLVAGIGLGVPIANANQATQASINVHAWAAYRVGGKQGERKDGTLVDLSPWAFIFGPSITFGSVGTNL